RLPAWVKELIVSVGQTKQVLRYLNMEMDLGDIRWGKGVLGKKTRPYIEMQKVCHESVQAGFHCYEEMFVWASYLLDCLPGVAMILRQRFPFVFIDEVQDNSEAQSVLLHRIFMAGNCSVRRQRFGDANQAIYGNASQSGAVTDA